ncbi:hypothetical protein LDENG_00274760 [Lucifuga dentata]|nr:hypothetical protein LDENG_00274760 [Lucifuga dentata]
MHCSGSYRCLAQPRLPSTILLAVGGDESSEQLSSNQMEAYDVCADEWTIVTTAQQPTSEFYGVVFLSRSVYCVGGWNEFDSLSSVVRYDLETHTWHEVAPMHRNRGCVGVTVLNGLIYVMGGSDAHAVHNTAECYEPETNQWTEIAPMHRKRNGASSTALHGEVYACGGSDEAGEILSSVECYSPETNQWTLIAPMSSRRTDFGVVAYAGQVYAMGGYSGTDCLDSAEAYNPETNSWNAVPSMPTLRSRFGIGIIDDRVYVVGGCSGTTTISSDVRFYNVRTGEWSEAANMEIRRRNLSCCVVSGLRNLAEYSAFRCPLPSDDSGSSSGEDEDEVG